MSYDIPQLKRLDTHWKNLKTDLQCNLKIVTLLLQAQRLI